MALVLLLLGGWLIVNDEEAADIINLAGRQRMLSQRMAMYLVLQQNAAEPQEQQRYGDAAKVAATEFDQANERLVDIARRHGQGSAIHSMYFGPAGDVDQGSRHYSAMLRAALEASTPGRSKGAEYNAAIAAADESLIKKLDQVTALYQRTDAPQETRILRLLIVSTLLIVGLVSFGTFGIFRPLLRRLVENIAAHERAQHDLKVSEERFKAFSEGSSAVR